jgi:tRNA threonylcarbamoyladenosine biosynthesis protein TsaB
VIFLLELILMLILGLDASTQAASVALVSGDHLLGEYFLNAGVPHSKSLLFMIDELLKRVGVGLSDIDALAVSTGPGSFTGLRLGISVVKALGMAYKKPLLAIPTLDALIQALPYSRHLLCPIMDAKKKQVYTALYQWEKNDWIRLTPDAVIAPEALAATLNQPVLFLGDAVYEYWEILRHLLKEKSFFAPSNYNHPRASQVALLGLKELKEKRGLTPQELAPRYIRRPEAEVNWDKNIKNKYQE